MAVETYSWPMRDRFRDRTRELAALERWWQSDTTEPVNLHGRRRVGKSWLFRQFAHDKPAVVLVADQVVIGQQLDHLADQLQGALGVKPRLDDVSGLVSVLYDLARDRKILVVIDEFPYLLGTTEAERSRTLSSIQAVMEQKQDSSHLKLILTGSSIATMESLQSERNPLHGRLRPLSLWPMPFPEATLLLETDDPLEQLGRYAIAGGMPRYLSALAKDDLATVIANAIVDPYSQLFNEPPTLLQTELREPTVYVSILARLSSNPQGLADIAAGLGMEGKELSKYLTTLESLRLVERRRPVGANPKSRVTQYRCTDHFIRFWFKFIQPFQGELEAGADPAAHVAQHIVPFLPEHTAIVFEEAVVSWLRSRHAGSSEVGAWWGPALNRLRAKKERFSEEVDAAALNGTTVVAVAEAKWTNKPMPATTLADLLEFKLPAMVQAGLKVNAPEIVLASRSGFSDGLVGEAAKNANVTLVGARQVLSDLTSR